MSKRIVEVPIQFKVIIELLRCAMLTKHLVKFCYKSESGNKGLRIIPPYMIIPRKGILELVGVPIEKLNKDGQPDAPICRFIYKDENWKKIKAEWLKIKYVK